MLRCAWRRTSASHKRVELGDQRQALRCQSAGTFRPDNQSISETFLQHSSRRGAVDREFSLYFEGLWAVGVVPEARKWPLHAVGSLLIFVDLGPDGLSAS